MFWSYRDLEWYKCTYSIMWACAFRKRVHAELRNYYIQVNQDATPFRKVWHNHPHCGYILKNCDHVISRSSKDIDKLRKSRMRTESWLRCCTHKIVVVLDLILRVIINLKYWLNTVICPWYCLSQLKFSISILILFLQRIIMLSMQFHFFTAFNEDAINIL